MVRAGLAALDVMHAGGDLHQRARRLVEPDVSVQPQPEDLQIDAAGAILFGVVGFEKETAAVVVHVRIDHQYFGAEERMTADGAVVIPASVALRRIEDLTRMTSGSEKSR